jgi:hypothetical protein
LLARGAETVHGLLEGLAARIELVECSALLILSLSNSLVHAYRDA